MSLDKTPSGTRVPITPKISWNVRKDMIRERSILFAADQTWLDRFVVRITRNRPHLRADIESALKRDLWDGVFLIPAESREAAMAQLMDRLDIPPAIDTYDENAFIIPKSRVTPDRPDRVFVTDHVGNAWTWNCGWYRIGSDGQPVDPSKRPLGHMTFRRSIKRATAEELGLTTFKYTRPWGDWRRGCGRYSHQSHGNVDILFTDGVHAIVRCPDGTKSEVHMTNLQPIGQPIARTSGKLDSNTTRGPRVRKSAQLTELDKAAIDDFLADLDMFELDENETEPNP